MQLFNHIKTSLVHFLLSSSTTLLSLSFTLPKTIASVGQACIQAVFTSPSFNTRSSFFALVYHPANAEHRKNIFPLHRLTNCYIRIQHHSCKIIIHLHVPHHPAYQLSTDPGYWETICTCIISPVKPAYFIRTVIRAISCSDTTVIGHLVNAFAAMVGRGIPDKHFRKAHYRNAGKASAEKLQLSDHQDFFHRSRNNGRYATSAYHDNEALLFYQQQDIIFSMTGNHTGATTNTTIQSMLIPHLIPGCS